MRYLCNLLYFSIILDVRSFPSCAPVIPIKIYLHLRKQVELNVECHVLTCVLIEVTAPLVCQSTMSGRCRDALRGGW